MEQNDLIENVLKLTKMNIPCIVLTLYASSRFPFIISQLGVSGKKGIKKKTKIGMAPQTAQTHRQFGNVAPKEYTKVIPPLTVKAPDPPNMPLCNGKTCIIADYFEYVEKKLW